MAHTPSCSNSNTATGISYTSRCCRTSGLEFEPAMEDLTLGQRFSSWWFTHASTFRWAAVILAILAAFAGLGYLVDDAPQTFLDYARVLAWPLVALVLAALFYKPIFRLFRGVYLKELDLSSGRFRFGERQEESNPDAFSALPTGGAGALPMDETAELNMLRDGTKITGALLQAFQIQIDFLKALDRAPEGLTRSAAEEWFRDELGKKQLDLGLWNIPQLITWMENNDLLSLDPFGRLVVSEHGENLRNFAEVFWYAPKLV